MIRAHTRRAHSDDITMKISQKALCAAIARSGKPRMSRRDIDYRLLQLPREREREREGRKKKRERKRENEREGETEKETQRESTKLQ